MKIVKVLGLLRLIPDRTFHCLVVLGLLFLVHALNGELFEGIKEPKEPQYLRPTVFVVMLVRNKAHTLPYFFYYFENLDYPKNRIKLWIRSDHNGDNSTAMVQHWLKHNSQLYQAVDFDAEDTVISYLDEEGPCDWSDSRFTHVMSLRQKALETARNMWADYVLFVDMDNLLINPQVLNRLIEQDQTIVAPMLNVTASEYYSNFWGGIDEDGYYTRSKDYVDIKQRHLEGLFIVPMVHSMMLIDLHHTGSRGLQFIPPPPGYNGPYDDIIVFAHSARHHNVPMYVLNDDLFGYTMMPMEAHNTLADEREQLLHILTHSIIAELPLKYSAVFSPSPPEPSMLGFDQVYMINLLRRPDRRKNMIDIFYQMGIKAKIIDAVDGKNLTVEYLQSLGVKMLPRYQDPYHKRPLTMGEIGCFLSHYMVWEDVLKNGYQKVIVFEDDVRFEPYFKMKLSYTMHEVEQLSLDWDLIYLGRKRLVPNEEFWVSGSETLVWPYYSYWTVSYLLSHSGATKLINQKPLGKMIPVDEYLPIMFDKHPEGGWKEQFYPRDLVGVSTEPLLVYPTHYTGEPGYITDTDLSEFTEVNQDTGDIVQVLRPEDSGKESVPEKQDPTDDHLASKLHPEPSRGHGGNQNSNVKQVNQQRKRGDDEL